MITLITGGSGSGKSAFAEGLVMKHQSEDKLYIATMMPYGEEGQKKVARHHKLRSGKGFETIEQYTDLDSLQIRPGAIVLLECMSNLTANEIFAEGRDKAGAVDRIMSGIAQLEKQSGWLYIVTNEVFSDGRCYDGETVDYIRCLGEINQKIAKMADEVVEVVYSIPVYHKKDAGR